MMYLVYKVTHDGRQDTVLAKNEYHVMKIAKQRGYNVTKIEYGVAQNNITQYSPHKNRPSQLHVKDVIAEEHIDYR